MSNFFSSNLLNPNLTTDNLFSASGKLGIESTEHQDNNDESTIEAVLGEQILVDNTSLTIETNPVKYIPPTEYDFPIYNPIPIDTSTKFDLDFSSNGQSIWSSGAGRFVDQRFLGVDWNKNGRKSRWGFGVFGSTKGKVGLQSDLEVDGGHVNTSLPIELKLDLPQQVTPGETITVESSFTLKNNAAFQTTNPYVDYDLDFLFDVEARAGAIAFGKDKSIFSLDRNYDRNLVSIDSRGANFSVSESQLKGLGSFNLEVPEFEAKGTKIDSDSLSSTNTDTFLDATLDLDGLASAILPIPPLEGSFNKYRVKANYNIFDLELNSELSVRQEFGVEVDRLTGQLVLENGDIVNFTVGDDITFTVPEGIGDSLEVDAFVSVDADFRNRTRLGIDVDADLEVLSASAKVDGPWPIPDFGVSIGPLYERSFNIWDTELDLYNRSFDLGGFDTQSVSFEIATV